MFLARRGLRSWCQRRSARQRPCDGEWRPRRWVGRRRLAQTDLLWTGINIREALRCHGGISFRWCTGRPNPRLEAGSSPDPEHFIPEEMVAAAGAKAHRSNIELNGFLSSMACGSSPSDWVETCSAMPPMPVGYASRSAASESHVAHRRHQRWHQEIPTGVEDLCRPHCSWCFSGSQRGHVMCGVLHYIVDQKSESHPSGEEQDKVSIQFVMQFSGL